MSDSPLLSKMDALLKKHRGGSEDVREVPPAPSPSSEHAAPPDARAASTVVASMPRQPA